MQATKKRRLEDDVDQSGDLDCTMKGGVNNGSEQKGDLVVQVEHENMPPIKADTHEEEGIKKQPEPGVLDADDIEGSRTRTDSGLIAFTTSEANALCAVTIRAVDDCLDRSHRCLRELTDVKAQGPYDLSQVKREVKMDQESLPPLGEPLELSSTLVLTAYLDSGRNFDAFRATYHHPVSGAIELVAKIARKQLRDCTEEVVTDAYLTYHLDKHAPGIGPKFYGLFRAGLPQQALTYYYWIALVEDVGVSVPVGLLSRDQQ